MTSVLEHDERAATRDATRWLAVGLVAIAAGLVVLAVLGPLGTGAVHYRVTETLRNQTIGLDAVSLFLVAPLAVFAAALVRRGHVAGPAIALGVGAYTAYMLVQYVVGPDYAHLPGNNERLFPLTAALFAAGWAVALTAWRSLDASRLPRVAGRARVILPVLAALAFIRYVPALADAMSGAPKDAGYLAGPAFFWTIALLDLGVFLPLTVATWVGLHRGRAWSAKALLAVAGWFGLVGPAVAGMAIAMQVNDDPNASLGATAFMTALGLAFTAFAVDLFRPLRRV
jgi:hypothetical protein